MSNEEETTVSVQWGDGPQSDPVPVSEMSTDRGIRRILEDGLAGAFGQQSLDICATCSHTTDGHADGPCRVEYLDAETGEVGPCSCGEFWPINVEAVDGLHVLGHEVGFGGAVSLPLDRRAAAELWEQLRMGRAVRLTVLATVKGKGTKAVKSGGDVVGVADVRKLAIEEIHLDGVG